MTGEEALLLILERMTDLDKRLESIEKHMERIKLEHSVIDAKLRLLMGSWSPPRT